MVKRAFCAWPYQRRKLMGYTKNIAVIRGLKDGFSSDGGSLSGLVKAERYGSHLKIEISYINFAPLTEGRYITALSYGRHTVIVENGDFDQRRRVPRRLRRLRKFQGRGAGYKGGSGKNRKPPRRK